MQLFLAGVRAFSVTWSNPQVHPRLLWSKPAERQDVYPPVSIDTETSRSFVQTPCLVRLYSHTLIS